MLSRIRSGAEAKLFFRLKFEAGVVTVGPSFPEPGSVRKLPGHFRTVPELEPEPMDLAGDVPNFPAPHHCVKALISFMSGK